MGVEAGGRKCTVCGHRRRSDIEADLAAGMPLQTMAKRWHIARQNIARHRDNHLAPAVQEARAQSLLAPAAERIAAPIMDRLNGVDERLEAIAEDAIQVGDRGTAIRALGEIKKLLELRARLTGELKDGGAVTVNMSVTHVQLQAITGEVIRVLEAFPEARAAVIAALERRQVVPLVEGEAA
jgi:hypothetical protein